MATHSSSGVLHLTYIQSFSRLVPCPHVSILFSDAIHLINIGFHFLCCFSLTFAQLLRILAWSIQSSLIDFSQTSSATLTYFSQLYYRVYCWLYSIFRISFLRLHVCFSLVCSFVQYSPFSWQLPIFYESFMIYFWIWKRVLCNFAFVCHYPISRQKLPKLTDSSPNTWLPCP